MNLFPPFTPLEISGQRWYLGLSVLLSVILGVFVCRLRQQTASRLRVGIWIVNPLATLFLLEFGCWSGVTAPVLTAMFILHCLLNAVGIGLELKRTRYALWGATFLSAVIIGVLLFPSVSTPQWSARLHQCRSQMKSLGLAVHNYAEVAAFRPIEGTRPTSWRVNLLPFLDSAPLGEGYDRQQPWDAAVNRTVGQRKPKPYQCPAHPDERMMEGFRCTDYALVTGLGTIFPSARTVLDFGQIGDGTTNTILMVECAGQRIPWTEPRDVEVARQRMTINELDSSGNSPSLISSYDTNPSHERKWCHILMADGSVRRLDPVKTDPQAMAQLMTANGGESENGY